MVEQTAGEQSQAPPEAQQPTKGNGAAAPWNGKLPLRKKVQDGEGNLVDELTFREPTGWDIERIGCPIVLSVFESQPKPIYDGAIMTSMMAHLATVPMSSIRHMDPRDWQNGAMMLFHFFVPDRFIIG